MAVLKEVKKEIGADLEYQKVLTKKVTELMFQELTKGQNLAQPAITPKQLADAVTGTVAGSDFISTEKPDALNQALINIFQIDPEDNHHASDE